MTLKMMIKVIMLVLAMVGSGYDKIMTTTTMATKTLVMPTTALMVTMTEKQAVAVP